MSTLLYLHGFGSSPQSWKATLLRYWIHDNRPDIELIIPTLPHYPADVAVTLETLLYHYPTEKFGIIGASMGGFYATWLSQRFSVPAVLINPLIYPADFLLSFIGQDHTTFGGDSIRFNNQHIEDFQAMQLPTIESPDLLWLLVQQGDEILPFQQAIEYYAECRQTIEKKGNHSFAGFENHVPELIRFLGL